MASAGIENRCLPSNMLGESAYPDWLTAEQSTGVSNFNIVVKSCKYWRF